MSGDFLIIAAVLISVVIIITMLIKNIDIKLVLLIIGVLLMFLATSMGKPLTFRDLHSSGSAWLDPFAILQEQFIRSIASAGIIILILGGFARYMQEIKASDFTVYALTRPLGYLKSPFLLIPFVFIVGNFLSLVIPSASTLAIILLATLYPVLRKTGMSTATAAALIATSATIIPTPLGSDSVAITKELSNSTEFFKDLTVAEYSFKYQAIVALPTLFLMMVLHVFWQQYQDRKNTVSEEIESSEEPPKISGGLLRKTVYSTLPLLPILLLLVSYIVNLNHDKGTEQIEISVGVAVFISFFLTILCELIRTRDLRQTLQDANSFFTGMASMMGIIILIVASSVFVVGLQSIGVIKLLEQSIQDVDNSGAILVVILSATAAVITLISGIGLSFFFAMLPLFVSLGVAADVSPIALSLPVSMSGGLFRAVSPVSAVIIIVSGVTKLSPLEIIKRTSVPCVGSCIFMVTLSIILYN